jgi:hypothetical protein
MVLFSFDCTEQLAPLVVLLQTVLLLQQEGTRQSALFTWRHLYDSFGIDPCMTLDISESSANQLQVRVNSTIFIASIISIIIAIIISITITISISISITINSTVINAFTAELNLSATSSCSHPPTVQCDGMGVPSTMQGGTEGHLPRLSEKHWDMLQVLHLYHGFATIPFQNHLNCHRPH